MKILVISGFLGAGKTTFIQELVKRTKRDFAIMENEYGAIGVDGDLLEQADTSINIWEMTEGCICCTRKADFASSILTIANTVDPEILLVEPTGVGELSKILENIKQIEYERITLLAPLTIVDGSHFEQAMSKFPDLCRDQIQAAGTVIVSKLEGASKAELADIQVRIETINEQCDISTLHYTKQPDSWWDALLERPLLGALSDGKAVGQTIGRRMVGEIPLDDIKGVELSANPVSKSLATDEVTNDEVAVDSVALTSISLRHEQELVLFLQGVTAGVFGDIVRAKGFLPVGRSWLQFSVVNGTYSITGFNPQLEKDEPEAKGIFIGTHIKRSWLREVLQKALYRNPDTIKEAAKQNKLKIGKISGTKRVS